MFCWGNTVNGELGLGGIEEEHILVPRGLLFNRSGNVVQVGCGESHTVMVTDDGLVYSCGSSDLNQLGHDKRRKHPEQVTALQAHFICRVSCGSAFTLVLNKWGQVFSWGEDVDGQLGHGVEQEALALPRMVKSLATKQVVQIACGYHHSVALVNTGQLYTWGQNQYGQLGLGTKGTNEHKPCLVKSLQGVPIALLACGGHHTIVLTKSGAVFSWGKNTFGQLGLNDDKDRVYPTLLRALRSQRIKYVCCGEDHTAALTQDGGVFTFGAGMYGQLGHNSTSCEIMPRKVLELMGSVVSQIACGRRHTLAYVPSRGKIYSFGLGGSGQLGINSTRNCTSPMAVYGPWVSLGAPTDNNMNSVRDTLTEKLVVRKIFSGGDQCFVKVSLQKDSVPPDDFRKVDPDIQILTLTIDKAEEFVQVPADEPVSQDIMSYIESVFSSPACINASFLFKNEEHFGCSRNNHGIDLKHTADFFEKVTHVKNPVLIELIKNCQEKEFIPELSLSPPDIEALRLYIILPHCHLFHEVTNFSSIVCPFGHAILNLRPEASKILDYWWGQLEIIYFLNIIQIYKKCVIHILDLPDTDNDLELIMRNKGLEVAMKILEKLNQVNKDSGHKVPYETFYIPEITHKMDVKLDYINWLQYGKQIQGGRLFFCRYPFLFDARAKSLLLQTDADLQMQIAVDEAFRRNITSLFVPIDPTNPFLVLYVTRENIVQDTIMQLAKHSSADLKKPLKVIFCGEDAVDAGGVRKEFFLLLLREILDPKYGMFKVYDSGNIWFNDQTFEDDNMFHLVGVLCGLAIYNGTIIAVPFPLALYKKLLKEHTKLEDLKDLLPDVAHGMLQLLEYEGNDVENVFLLTFEITRDIFGEIVTTELKPGGSNVQVNKENRAEYVNLYVNFILNNSVEKQFNAFYDGFHKVCGGRVLELFHSQELMAMVIGNENYNWEELEENTEYKNGYTKNDLTIKLFWKVFHSLSVDEKKQFLLFLTGSDRIPILGMKSVKIYIQPTGGGEHYLPVAHTCFNLLDLPRYTTEEILRRKLLQSIENSQGFGLA